MNIAYLKPDSYKDHKQNFIGLFKEILIDELILHSEKKKGAFIYKIENQK